MADIRITYNVALTGLPVNKTPLVDATTGATIQSAVTYNQAGLALYFHFVTTAGVYTEAAITPTTGGLYDWTDSGASGIYTIEMPISGGTTNGMNTRKGYGWFTGSATGILPWSSPIYEFVPANVSESLTNGTEWLEVTAHAPRVEKSGSDLVIYKQDDTTEQFRNVGTFSAPASTDVLTALAGKT